MSDQKADEQMSGYGIGPKGYISSPEEMVMPKVPVSASTPEPRDWTDAELELAYGDELYNPARALLSRDRRLDAIREVIKNYGYDPMNGGKPVVNIDRLLAVLDGVGNPAQTDKWKAAEGLCPRCLAGPLGSCGCYSQVSGPAPTEPTECSDCSGAGHVGGEPCYSCQGTGVSHG